MRKRTVVIGFLVIAPILCPFVFGADNQSPSNNSPYSGSPWDWDVGPLIKLYSRGLTRLYNLDEKQEVYTEKLLTQRLKRFLGQHDREVRSLFSEYFAYQTSGQLPPREAAKEFSQRARPMLSAIHKEIMDGNLKWREILNDEQKRIHDRDLDSIDRTFQQYDERFSRWSRGQVEPDDFPGAEDGGPRRMMNFEDTWGYYVRRFIEDYRLDQSQQETAQSILRELRKEATTYREAHKSEFDAIDAQYQEFTGIDPKTDPEQYERAKKEMYKLDAQRERVARFINVSLFSRLKQKLTVIPRGDQREAYDQRRTRLQQIAARAQAAYQARVSGSQPASTTQPTTQDAPTAALAEP